MDALIATFRAWISNQVSHYDASHDIVHIDNVVSNCIKILNDSSTKYGNISKNKDFIYLATVITALAHDVCDKKYVRNVKSKLSALNCTLCRLGLHQEIVTIVTNVVPRISFSKTLKLSSSSYSPTPKIRLWSPNSTNKFFPVFIFI